jgi:ankyrin repeat protein
MFVLSRGLALRTVLAGAAFWLGPSAVAGTRVVRGPVAPPIELVARHGTERWTDFEVIDGEIHAKTASGAHRLPREVVWSVEGDFRANAHKLVVSPLQVTGVFEPARDGRPVQTYGVVVTDHRAWRAHPNSLTLLVAMWLRSGEPVQIRVQPVDAEAFRKGACVSAIHSDQRLLDSAPVLALWTPGGFVDSKPIFDIRNHQRAAEALLLAPEAERGILLRKLQRIQLAGTQGRNLLFIAAESGDVSSVRTILERIERSKVDLRSTVHPLDAAAAAGRENVVDLLVPRLGFRIEALMFARRNGHDSIARALAESAHSARLDSRGRLHMSASATTLILSAVAARDEALASGILELVLPSGDLAGGRTLMMVAAGEGLDEFVARLIACGYDIDARSADRSTALHAAVGSGRASTVRLLLARGADFAVENAAGATPLTSALDIGRADIAEILAEAGARLDPASDLFPRHLVASLVLDQMLIVERAITDGWDPCARIGPEESMCPFAIAEALRVERVRALLAGRGIGPSGNDLRPVAEPDVAARVIEVRRPPDPRAWTDRIEELHTRVVGLVDANGAFLFPRVDCTDAALSRLLLRASTAWRFEPAQVGDEPVASQVSVRFKYAAVPQRVYTLDEVDTQPQLISRPRITSSRTETDSARLRRENPDSRWSSSVHPAPIETPITKLVVFSCTVEVDGRVEMERILLDSGDFLSVATSALGGYRFTPGRIAGNPVRTRVFLAVQPNVY